MLLVGSADVSLFRSRVVYLRCGWNLAASGAAAAGAEGRDAAGGPDPLIAGGTRPSPMTLLLLPSWLRLTAMPE